MRYAIAAMQNHLDAGYKTLPMVVPLLFYHGIESPYPYSLCWLDCFADPNLARQLYASAFPLIDVTLMPDDEIMLHRRMALLELIQKHIRQRDLMGLVEQMACLLSSGYANGRQIKGLFNYILQTGDAVRFNDFIDGVAKRSPKHKVSLMTIAERLRQEGEQSKALHIAKIMLNPESLLQTSCALPGCQKKSWLRRASKVLSRHFESHLHPLLQRHQQMTKLVRM